MGLSLWVRGTRGRGCEWMRSWWAELGAQVGTCLLEAQMQLSCGRTDVLVGAEEKLFQTCGEMCFWREVRQQPGAGGTSFFRLHITPSPEECSLPVSPLLFVCSGETFQASVVRSDRKHRTPPTHWRGSELGVCIGSLSNPPSRSVRWWRVCPHAYRCRNWETERLENLPGVC